jgi:DNA-directed RNA polymerase specialized sigma24 family protein
MQHRRNLCVFITDTLKTAGLELTAPILHDELVERCKQRDARSYGELYQKYSKAMYNTSLRIVNNTGDAEDVLQEAFTDAFTSIDTFQYKSTFGAWLKKIVINKSINQWANLLLIKKLERMKSFTDGSSPPQVHRSAASDPVPAYRQRAIE